MVSPTKPPQPPLLSLDQITLNYGRIRALGDVSLSFHRHEVHAIVGEHGAGKSSLANLISGTMNPDSGHIRFEGKRYKQLNPKLAIKLGISMVHQQVHLNDYFTLAENLFFPGKKIGNVIWHNKKKVHEEAESLLKQYQFDLDPSMMLKQLNLADQTLVDILKSISQKPKVLILDEAIERLSTNVMRSIIRKLIQMKQQGLCIIFITHRIDDIYDFADRVTIIKGGRVLLTDHVRNIDKIYLIKMAYTQISIDDDGDDISHQFHHFLKFNEAILKKLPVNLIVTDSENRIKMVNDYCMDYFHLDGAFYPNYPLESLFSSDNDYFLSLVEKSLNSDEVNTYYRVPLILDNIKKVSNLKILPIFDGETRIGNIFIIEDITEYDHLQNQLILSEKLASVGLLAAGVAHEINNPLEIIYNYLSFIQFQVTDPELVDALKCIHNEINFITNIVSNLHSFSDNRRSTLEDCELNGLIQDMLTLIKHHALKKNISLEFRPSEKDIIIKANPNEIKQVILNLLKNSFEALLENGEIYIETNMIEYEGGQWVEVVFIDNGPGIRTENPDDIFLPFYSTKKGGHSNLGLGLSVSYGIVKKYMGLIKVRNVEGFGCEFKILLPLSESTNGRDH